MKNLLLVCVCFIAVLVVLSVLAVAILWRNPTTVESTQEVTFGKHNVVIVDKSKSPSSETLSQDYSGATPVLRYKGSDLDVLLKENTLTVNGLRYTLGDESDSIKIIDGVVEINGKPATPDRIESP